MNILDRIEGTEDIAEFLKPDAVLELMRLAKQQHREIEKLQAAATDLMAAIDNMHERGETLTAYVSIAAAEMRRALEQNSPT
jgi:cell division protein FtsB